MDDLTWQRSLALRDQRIRRQKYGLLLSAIAAILGAIAIWYGCFYTKTPEYALKEAQAAIEQYVGSKRGYKKNKYQYAERTRQLVEQHWGDVLRQWDYQL